MDAGSLAGLKALYSDARKRAAVAAGIGAYLYTALAPVELPIGPDARQVQAIRRQGKSDLLALSPETEAWLRRGYEARMQTEAVRARPRPDARPRRTRDRDGPGRDHRPGRTATEPRATDAPATETPAAAANGQRRPRHASTSAASGPPTPEPRDQRGARAARRPGGRRRLPARGARPLIAEAALPGYRPGDRLDDAADRPRPHGGRDPRPSRPRAEALPALIADYRDRYDAHGWREQFWRHQLRTACRRFNHPALYGSSPCERAAAEPAPRLNGDPSMTQLALAAGATAPAAGPPGAAELAARIQVPRRLPDRYDGQPMRHLSNSSYTRFLLCPEDWRRHYLKGERFPISGPMFLGSRVDDALSLYYQRILDHGDALALDQVKDAYRDLWQHRLADEHDQHGIRWDDELDEPRAFEIGLMALELTFAELVPRLGVAGRRAAQARVRARARPRMDRPVLPRPRDATRRRATVTSRPRSSTTRSRARRTPRARPTRDPQAGLYLAGRWLTGEPARDFSFAQIAKPGKRRKQMSASLVTTHRTIGQLRASLVRIAQAARQIDALHEHLGPDAPWGFADPAGWKCAPAYCHHYTRGCPGGAGL